MAIVYLNATGKKTDRRGKPSIALGAARTKKLAALS